MKELLTHLVRSLVDAPDCVSINETTDAYNNVLFEVSVSPEDMGRVIGKQGRIAKAIRSVMNAAAARENRRVTVEIV